MQAVGRAGVVGAIWNCHRRLPTHTRLQYVSPRSILKRSQVSLLETQGRVLWLYAPDFSRVPIKQRMAWFPAQCTNQCVENDAEAKTQMELEKKKCVPCDSRNLQPMTWDSAQTLLSQIPGWEIQEVKGVLQLHKSWKAKSFVKALEFLKRVADVAEHEGHHPDLHLVNWNQLSIDISTHSIGGLTENDFIVAAKISALSVEDLLRKPALSGSKPPS